jgi:hypothetical protein
VLGGPTIARWRRRRAGGRGAARTGLAPPEGERRARRRAPARREVDNLKTR